MNIAVRTGIDLDLPARLTSRLSSRRAGNAIHGDLTTPASCAVVFIIALLPPFASAQVAQQSSADGQLPAKPPVSILSYNPATAIPPMRLAERIKHGIVPKRGIVSTGVNGGALLSGDGKMMVEVPGNPWAEEVIFDHER